MIAQLLVPLDGSKLSETAAGFAAKLARKLAAKVTLLHVIEAHPPRTVHHERHLSTPAEAEEYLRSIAQREMRDLTVDLHVHENPQHDVARSIDQHARELNPDLIVMCTHGRSGPMRWVYGSIAQQVVGLGPTPLLMLPAEHAAGGDALRRILVPLDGERAHESALPLVSDLAKACAAEVNLLLVVPSARELSGERGAAARMLPATMTAVLDLEEENARKYLGSVMARLRQQGLSVSAETRRGDPARTITRAAEETRADLLALSTHGKSGTSAFWAGSVASPVVLASPLPVLLVPAR